MDNYEYLNAKAWNDPVEGVPPKDAKIRSNASKHTQERPSHGSVRPVNYQLDPNRGIPQAVSSQAPYKLNESFKRRGGTDPAATPSRDTRKPRLLIEADNEAAALWRAYEDATDVLSLPSDLILRDNSYERLAYELGTFVECMKPPNHAKIIKFGIWGNPGNVAATKQAILKWVQNARRKGERFSKLASLTPAEHEVTEREFRRKVRQHRYRQRPPPDMGFGAVGTFYWPVEEYRPEEVFGLNYEALDQIRMDFSCYIVFVKERTAFQICGKADDVQEALLRMRKTYFQVVARMINPIREYLIHWPLDKRISSQVTLEEYSNRISASPEPKLQGGNTFERNGLSPRATGLMRSRVDVEKIRIKSTQSTEFIGETIQQMLRRIHFYHGRIDLQVRLGTFVLEQYLPAKDDIYTLDEYESMTKFTQFRGSVTEEFGDRGLERKILSVLKQADGTVIPVNNLGEDLDDATPIYSAVFVFKDTSGDIRLEVSWHQLDVGSRIAKFALSDIKWTRLDRDTAKPNELLDMSLVDLHTGTAMQFEILASDYIDPLKVPTSLQGFEELLRLKVDAQHYSLPTEATIEFPRSSKIKLFREQTTYAYTIPGTDYHLHLTRFRDHVFQERDALHPRPNETIYEPRWALSVGRMEWKTKLSGNECLPIGTRAEWSDEPDEWFPKIDSGGEGSGFAQLVKKVQAITALIREIASNVDDDDEETAGMFRGMTIG